MIIKAYADVLQNINNISESIHELNYSLHKSRKIIYNLDNLIDEKPQVLTHEEVNVLREKRIEIEKSIEHGDNAMKYLIDTLRKSRKAVGM